MPERPLLILPALGEPVQRRKRGSGGGRFGHPGRERQAERLTPQFELLQRALEARRVRLQAEAQGLIPEEVIVLETIGTVENFIRAVERVPGMEWLGEIEEEDIPPDDDFFIVDKHGQARHDKPLSGRLFLIVTNQKALRQMLSLWEVWQRDERLPRGFGPWRILFEHLRNVRPWGVEDRLVETGVLDDWRERVEHEQQIVPCEIELWYRRSEPQRQAAAERVANLITEQEGEIVHEAVIEDIAYHALLANLPIATIETLVQQAVQDMELVQCEQIQFFRASGQMAAVIPDGEQDIDHGALPDENPAGTPVIALFDGMPLQAHRRLEARLIVDDPDGFEEDYPAGARRHGTAMASLIVHGDLGQGGMALARPLYVRPILRPDPRDWHNNPPQEVVPEDTLIIDLLHRAVRRLFGKEGDEEAVAPNVVVINLSIGIRDRPFDSSLSPLARLLDWLAWRYRVLFVVSAGNHSQRIGLSVPRGTVHELQREELQAEIVRAVAADARYRRLLSPAEAVNALTVGAASLDSSNGPWPPQWIEAYAEPSLPSPINAQGMGYRRAIKPEILAPGGRTLIQDYPSGNENAEVSVYNGSRPPGQCVASPGAVPGDISALWHTRGTSNATALVSRAASMLHDTIDELREEPGGEIIDAVPRSIWLKVLLAHSVEWGAAGPVLDEILRTDENSRQFKEYVTRLIGYGSIDPQRVQECNAYRVTALGGGVLVSDRSHIHRYPLPPALSGQTGYRRLVITLAWFTPVNPRHQGWRRAHLWFAPPKDPLRVERQEAHWQAALRGTLQHEILEGSRAAAFVDGDNLEVQVSCRPDAGNLEDEIPYALAITLEVAEDIGIEIYDEIRLRVHAASIRVAPTGQ